MLIQAFSSGFLRYLELGTATKFHDQGKCAEFAPSLIKYGFRSMIGSSYVCHNYTARQTDRRFIGRREEAGLARVLSILYSLVSVLVPNPPAHLPCNQGHVRVSMCYIIAHYLLPFASLSAFGKCVSQPPLSTCICLLSCILTLLFNEEDASASPFSHVNTASPRILSLWPGLLNPPIGLVETSPLSFLRSGRGFPPS